MSREYTPINATQDFLTSRRLQLLIKRYPEGAFTKPLLRSKIGDPFFVSTPKVSGDFNYLKRTDLESRPRIAFIAAGSGIAPVYQIIQQMAWQLKSGLHVNPLTLLFSNKTKQDILLHQQLEAFQKEHPGHFNVVYTLTREKLPESEPFLCGRVSEDILKRVVPAEKHFHILVSGPEGFWETCFPILLKLGYIKEECTELFA